MAIDKLYIMQRKIVSGNPTVLEEKDNEMV
jgi:hypothetical protein